MSVISNNVREQQRYTKQQLKTLFSFDETELSNFIKKLKAYGILKTVSKNKEEEDLTDLLEDELILLDDDSTCFYVFKFVGVVCVGDRIIKVFPKYILPDHFSVDKFRLVLRALEKYNNVQEQIIHFYTGNNGNNTINPLALVLYFLRDYDDYGLYNNLETVVEMNGNGDILWSKTVDEGFAIVQGNRPYYIDLYTTRSVDDLDDYFRKLHEYIITDCSKQLMEFGLDQLFQVNPVFLSDAQLNDFGDKEYILDRLLKELGQQFYTHKQMLLKSMYTYIAGEKGTFDDASGISIYGTTSFHVVWEKLCSFVFSNQLQVSLGQLRMKIPLGLNYNEDLRLIDLIEKPKWRCEPIVKEANETLIPDIISITRREDKYYFVILDAKYYMLRLVAERPLSGNPGIGDVTKQYLYQLAYQQFVKDHQFDGVVNCFIMPTDQSVIIDKGTACMEMLSSLGLSSIFVRQVPAEMVYQHYLAGTTIPISDLRLF